MSTMTDTPGLVAWLRAQIDEDERRAAAARDRDYGRSGSWGDGGPDGLFTGAELPRAVTVHMATHDPARVLRAVTAKRQLVNASIADCPTACRTEHSFSGSCNLRWMGPAEEAEGQRWVDDEDGTRVLAPQVVTEWALRLLATEYADRDGYLPEWRP